MMPETTVQPARRPATENSPVDRTRQPDTSAIKAMQRVTGTTPRINRVAPYPASFVKFQPDELRAKCLCCFFLCLLQVFTSGSGTGRIQAQGDEGGFGRMSWLAGGFLQQNFYGRDFPVALEPF
jgi:hypothetical protein